MTRPVKLVGWFGLWFVLPALTALPALPVMAEEAMEEIVVTGSYIRRDSFDSSSPLSVVSAEDIAINATPNLGEVLVNQTFNYGSDYQTNTYATRAQGGQFTQANLRGLGPRATLQLIDGKRTLNSNLNDSIPQIAISRIDLLRDGAAATYGSDAVAGVVNIIPRKNFSGVEMSSFFLKGDDLDERSYEFIMGSDTDNGHLTLSGSFRTRGQLQQEDRPEYVRGDDTTGAPGGFIGAGWDISGTGNPGDWLVPNRDPVTGALTGTGTRLRDPGCGVSDGPGGRDAGKKRSWQTGDDRFGGANCRLHFGEWWNYMNPNSQWSLWTNYTYSFSDNLNNEMDILVLHLDADSRGSAQNPGGRTEEFPIVLGTHPGNPYRAFADANANGVIDANEALFAQDLFDVNGNAGSDGIPDRDVNADVNGDGVPDVILSATPFTAGAGSIAFNEDVDVVALRAFSKLGNRATTLNADGSNNGNSTFKQTNIRVYDELTYSIPDSSWEIVGWGLYELQAFRTENKNTSQRGLEQGLRGELFTEPPFGDLAISPKFWNPFSTQQLTCTDRVCTDSGTLANTVGADGLQSSFPNTVAVLDAVNILATNTHDIQAYNFQLLGTGDLIEIPTGGMIAAAFGVAYRNVNIENDINAPNNNCDWHEGGCRFDWTENQDYYSAFYEFFVPVLDNLDLQLAGNYVDYGGGIGDSFDPKFAVSYRPVDVLSLRGSWSSAFIAPSLTQLFEPSNCGLQLGTDLITGDVAQTARATCFGGTPTLQNETATVWNVGASASLLDGDLNVGVDYAVYDFEDRISIVTFNQRMRQNFAAFTDSGRTVPASPTTPCCNTPEWADTRDWIDNFETSNINRDVTDVITSVTTERVNAQEMKHKAWDFYGRYTRAIDTFGTFTWGLSATYIDEYTFDLGDGVTIGDGAGKQNENIAEVPPLPQWRVNGTINWLYGDHTANVRVRYMTSFELNTASFGDQGESEKARYIDLQYGYQLSDILGTGRDARLEVGVRNVTDWMPDPIFDLGGIETFVHDIRGRMFYGRINVNL